MEVGGPWESAPFSALEVGAETGQRSHRGVQRWKRGGWRGHPVGRPKSGEQEVLMPPSKGCLATCREQWLEVIGAVRSAGAGFICCDEVIGWLASGNARPFVVVMVVSKGKECREHRERWKSWTRTPLIWFDQRRCSKWVTDKGKESGIANYFWQLTYVIEIARQELGPIGTRPSNMYAR